MGKTGSISFSSGVITFYTLFLLVPVTLWIGDAGKQLFFDRFFSSVMTVAKFAGIVGLCFFSGNLMLSGRYAFLDRLFGGLDKVFLFHKRTGIYAFSLITVHAASMLTTPLQSSIADALRFAFDVANEDIFYGKLAYLVFLSLIAVTLFFAKRFKYERLKWLHSWMGVAFLLGGLHALSVSSDTAFNMPLRVYVFTVIIAGFASYLSRTVLEKLLVRRRALDVTEVNILSGGVTEVIMKLREGERVAFKPGQFVFARFRQDNFPYEDHPFSITASDSEEKLRISVKAVGDYTSLMPQLRSGAIAEIQGPFGGFSFVRAADKRQIWVAGGIGITPFLSMARSIRDGKLCDYDIDLYYSVQTEGDLVFVDELRAISAKYAYFRVHAWVTEVKGYITADAIEKKTSLNGRDVFICGPQPMMLSLSSQLAASGTPRSRIHFELFKLLT